SLFYSLYRDQQASVVQTQIERRATAGRHWDKGVEAEAAAHLARAEGQEAEATRLFALAAEQWDRALAMLDAADEGLVPEITRRRAEVRQELDALAARHQARIRTEQFFQDRDRALLHEVSLAAEDEAANKQHLRRLVPAALARLGLPLDRPPAEFLAAF